MVDPRTGGWYTVGDGGAEFTNIPSGAIVFNHKQTEALFKYGKVAGRGRALASGTAMAGGSTDSFDNGRIPLSATAALDIELNVNDKDLEKKLEKELSEMSDKLEYILGQYEHEIFLIEKNAINGFTEEDTRNVISIYRKMMDEVHAQADAARAKGLSDNSKTVMELSKRWFELRDNIKDAINDYYESLISKTSNSIKLLDFQMGELQNKVRNRWVKNPNDAWIFSDSGSNYDDILGKMNEVIEKQREIQAAAHDGADEMRTLGFEDSSDEITKFKDEWADASDAIVEAITTAYDAITGDLENRVTLTENWLNNAVTDADFDKVVKYSDDIYDYYTQMQTAIHDEADRLRALGYSDTSEEVSKLSDLWHDYEEKRKAMALDAWKEIVDATKVASKEIVGVYNTLQKAADDYAKFGGYISLDSMEALLEMGPQYLRFLQDENGLWTINREAIEKVIAAKYEDLAVTNALSYVDRLRLAVEGKSNEKLDDLLGITNDLTGATWDLVYAKLADIDMTEEQFNIALENIKRIESLSHNAIGGIGMTLFGDADRYASGMSDLIKYVMDMLADRLKEQTDKLKDQADEYSKIIDRKKESLRLTKEENDYQKDISDKMKEAAKLQEKIDLLALDDSRKGQAERLKLQENLSSLQEEVA